MIKASTGWNISNLLMVAVFVSILTACGGGGGSGVVNPPAQTLLQQVQALIATNKPNDLEAAFDLFLNNQDKLSAADFETLMDALIGV